MNPSTLELFGLLLIIWFAMPVLKAVVTWFFGSEEESQSEFQKILDSCPPHQWEEIEQVGMPKVHYLQCKKCKQFPNIDARV